jgi:hypothetical protein
MYKWRTYRRCWYWTAGSRRRQIRGAGKHYKSLVICPRTSQGKFAVLINNILICALFMLAHYSLYKYRLPWILSESRGFR